jgi:hypothetical protein
MQLPTGARSIGCRFGIEWAGFCVLLRPKDSKISNDRILINRKISSICSRVHIVAVRTCRGVQKTVRRVGGESSLDKAITMSWRTSRAKETSMLKPQSRSTWTMRRA